MSKYTTEVRFICESLSGLDESKGLFDVDEIIEKSRIRIFDFPYPIFDESYKPTLEKKILMHYYTREISEETYGLWKLRLRTRLNEIMPYYNQLYNSELIKYNPLWDTDLDTKRDVVQDNVHEDETVTDNNTDRTQLDHYTTDGQDVHSTDGSDVSTMGGRDVSTAGGRDVATAGGEDVLTAGGTDVSTAGGEDVVSTTKNDVTNTWDLYSDTPQGAIAGIEGAEDSPSLGDNGYLTNARHVIGDTDGSVGSGTTEYGRTDTTDYGRTDTREYGRTDTKDYGRTDTTDYGRSDTTEYGKIDTTEYGKVQDLDRKENDKFDGNVKTDGTRTDRIDFFEKVTGYRGRNPSESLLKFRETFLNIDMMIIKELRPLFFNLW